MKASRDPMSAPEEPGKAGACELSCGTARARVQLMGAELSRWTCHGRDLLWSGDERWWPRHSPLLFPVVGHLRDGQAWRGGSPRPMGCHGFAAGSPFTLQQAAGDRVSLLLTSDEATRAVYPYDFALHADYHLTRDALDIGLTLVNQGPAPLPYSIGLHPGFHALLANAGATGHAIVFGADESPWVPVITPAGLFTSERRRLPMAGRRLPLTPALLAREALCFLQARSRSLAFEAPDGSAIEIEAMGFDHWALWSPLAAPFVCIEAWTGHGDAEDFQGEFAARPSTRTIAPGRQAHHALRLRFRAAGGGG